MSKTRSTYQRYRSYYLDIDEERLSVSSIDAGYDLLICFSSWEVRCQAIALKSAVSAHKTIIFHFDPSHAPADAISRTGDAMGAALRTRGVVEIERVPLSRSTEFGASLHKMKEALRSTIDRTRIFNVAIDISSLPIGYTQGMVGWLIDQGWCSSIDCYYVEPEYEAAVPSDGASGSIQFTTGSWQLAAVPHLEGRSFGGRAHSIFVCIGAESDNTRELLLSREYSSVAMVRPESSLAFEWTQHAVRDTDDLASKLPVIGDGCKGASPFSVCSIIQYYERTAAPQWVSSEKSFVALGTKPHGLAGALCGLSDPTLCVFARVPASYTVRGVNAGSHCWRYRIRDLSSPLWASTDSPDWLW